MCLIFILHFDHPLVNSFFNRILLSAYSGQKVTLDLVTFTLDEALGCLPHRAYTLGETLHYADSPSLCFHNTKAQLKLLKPKRSLLPTPSFSTWKTLVPGFLSDLSEVTRSQQQKETRMEFSHLLQGL